MIIRELKKEDAFKIAELIRQLTKNILDEENFISRIEKLTKPQNYQYYVAEVDGEVLGFGGLAWHPIPSKGLIAWLEEVIVDEKARGQGIGRALMEKFLAKAQEKGCRQVKLTTSNPVAKSLYEKFGFTEKDEHYMIRKNY